MTRDYAYLHVLANFAYIDNEIASQEIEKIKSIMKKLKLNGNVEEVIKFVVENALEQEIEEYAQSIAYLSENLTDEEKGEFLKYAADVITADGKIYTNEIIKLELLAKNWDIELSKVL